MQSLDLQHIQQAVNQIVPTCASSADLRAHASSPFYDLACSPAKILRPSSTQSILHKRHYATSRQIPWLGI